MTNTLVGDVYQKIIEEVVAASTNDFEESGVGQATLNELKQAWQVKLSQRGVAQMPWDPKPEPAQRIVHGTIVNTTNSVQQSHYGYSDDSVAVPQPTGRVKLEATNDPSYQTAQQAYGSAPPVNQQGGIARAQELVQERFGQQAAAAIQRPTGLALPVQQTPQGQQHLTPQQHYAQQQMMQARQQQALHNQQSSPHVKLENESPRLPPQGQFAPQQRLPNPSYAQTDGADDLAGWQTYYASRRALHADTVDGNDQVMREQIRALTEDLSTGLLLPFDAQQARHDKRKQRQAHTPRRSQAGPSSLPSIPQLDGDDDNEENVKDSRLDDEDDDAINSDLDDPDDDQNPIGDDDDDLGDSILCTYDKVQRVKNKWKCTLKDGVLNTGGKEWLFHKGQGEFEW